MNISEITSHLYNDSLKSAVDYVKSISDEETLFVYAYNYNWDNGFEVPRTILDNPNCTLNVALLLFHLADGMTYLETKTANPNLPEWSNFISSLYVKIMENCYTKGSTALVLDYPKVQLLKLKKSLFKDEYVFITEIAGTDCNIIL